MNKLIFIALVAALFGCAGTDTGTPKEQLGTAKEPIFMPSQYGIEGGGFGPRCIPPWDNGQCWVPDNTGSNVVLRFWVNDASCGADLAGKVHAALNKFVNNMNSLGLQAFIMTAKLDARYFIQCANNNPGVLAHFVPISQETHSTVNGTLVQHGSGNIFIDGAQITATPCWQQGAITQHNAFMDNITSHELYHVAGSGHETSGTGARLMDPAYSGALNTNACQVFLDPTPADIAAIDCYNATSGTGDRCAD